MGVLSVACTLAYAISAALGVVAAARNAWNSVATFVNAAWFAPPVVPLPMNAAAASFDIFWSAASAAVAFVFAVCAFASTFPTTVPTVVPVVNAPVGGGARRAASSHAAVALPA